MKRIPLVWQIIAGLVLGVLVGWYFNTHPQYQGWISSEWGTSENNRRAKFYSLSKAGRRQLVAEAENWQRVSGVIGKLLLLGAKRG